jgi:TPR repeat protein
MNQCTNMRVFFRTASVLFAAAAWLLFASCERTPGDDLSGATAGACIADSIQDLKLPATVPPCEPRDEACRAKCLAGSATSCLGMAYAAQADSREAEAIRLFQRACLLGNANACTNYAASIWANDHSDEQLTCAQRTFEKACAAKEPFACGMVGRVMIESTTPPRYAEGRRYLEKACDEVSGFPCRVLAKHLESGKLGLYQPGVIRSLLTRACAAGDPDACGEPASAGETFD